MTSARTFHVEVTMTKVIEVEITDDMMFEDEDIEAVVQEAALMRFNESAHIIDEDYQIEAVQEVAPPVSA